MNGLDIVILLLFIPGIIRGVSKGFIEQAVSLAGLVASVSMAFSFSSLVCEKIKPYLNVSDTILSVVSFILILIAVSVMVMLVAGILTSIVKKANLGWINRFFGVVLGIAISGLLIALLIILFDTVNEKFQLVTSPILEESFLYGSLKDLGYYVFPYLQELGTIVVKEISA